jgi:hypothetical protein
VLGLLWEYLRSSGIRCEVSIKRKQRHESFAFTLASARDSAAWLLLAWLASIRAVSALLGVITIEFFQATAGYVLLLSALTSATLLAIYGIARAGEDGRSTRQRSS